MAQITMLGIITEFCRRKGMPIPAVAAASQDDTTYQMVGLLNEAVDYITSRAEWQGTVQRYGPFTHAGLVGYGALDLSEAGPVPDYGGMINLTLWDNNSRRPVYGPLSASEWEFLLNMNVSQAVYNHRLYGNVLRIYPVPTDVTQTFSFEYLSKYGVVTAASDVPPSTATQWFTTDNSISRLPSSILLNELRWRWSAEKGLPYAELQRNSEEQITTWLMREPQPTLSLDNYAEFPQVVGPGLLVAAGSWNV